VEKEFLQVVAYARGSFLEIKTQLIIEIGFGLSRIDSTDVLFKLTTEVGRLIDGLMRSLNDDIRSESPAHPSAFPPQPTTNDFSYTSSLFSNFDSTLNPVFVTTPSSSIRTPPIPG